MRGKDLLLLLKNITNLFLKSKELLILLIPHGPLHGIKIILNFLFIFLFGLFLNLNLLINNIFLSRTILVGLFLLDCLLRGLLGLVGLEVWLFVGVWTVLLFWLLFFHVRQVVVAVGYTVVLLGWWGQHVFAWLGSVVAVRIVGFWDVFWHLAFCLDWAFVCVWAVVWVLTVWDLVFWWLLFFYHLWWIYFVNILFRNLFLALKTSILLHNLVTFFTQFSLIFQSISIPQCI